MIVPFALESAFTVAPVATLTKLLPFMSARAENTFAIVNMIAPSDPSSWAWTPSNETGEIPCPCLAIAEEVSQP